MKKIREWSPSVKIFVGLGVFVVSTILMILPVLVAPSPEEAAQYSIFLELAVLPGMAGLILLIWGLFQWLAAHPRIRGVLLLTAGLILTPVFIFNIRRIWEWSKGGVVNFIPAPFLVPLIFVIPGFLIFYGIAEIRQK